PSDVDLIVYTVAINKYEPQLLRSIKERFSIQIKSYPEMLGVLTHNKFTIAISGTHGKTTTTAMIAKMLIDAGKDPSVIVGSLMAENKSNLVIGASDIFVVEACEYERDFLHIKPDILVITNVEAEHLDYYRDLKDVETAFTQMVLQTKKVVVADFSNENIIQLCTLFEGEVINYVNFVDKVPTLRVPGVHNRLDAACAYAVGECLDIPDTQIKQSLASFLGTWRRLEKKGETLEGVIIYDDYAHHPTEVKASLQGLRELYPDSKITIVFQPHLYSRTKALYFDFLTAFGQADEVILLPIYFAREAPDPEISSEKLAQGLRECGVNARAVPDFIAAEVYVASLELKRGELLVTMGAGEAYKVSEKLFNIIN
ncbi:MAG: UDP-N-acetylmuramate--L-alanine ligase, partial [Candidatus Paceibacterota bacterium]